MPGLVKTIYLVSTRQEYIPRQDSSRVYTLSVLVKSIYLARTRQEYIPHKDSSRVIIIIIIILLKQDCKVQLAINKIQMAWLTSWLVAG